MHNNNNNKNEKYKKCWQKPEATSDTEDNFEWNAKIYKIYRSPKKINQEEIRQKKMLACLLFSWKATKLISIRLLSRPDKLLFCFVKTNNGISNQRDLKEIKMRRKCLNPQKKSEQTKGERW